MRYQALNKQRMLKPEGQPEKGGKRSRWRWALLLLLPPAVLLAWALHGLTWEGGPYRIETFWLPPSADPDAWAKPRFTFGRNPFPMGFNDGRQGHGWLALTFVGGRSYCLLFGTADPPQLRPPKPQD